MNNKLDNFLNKIKNNRIGAIIVIIGAVLTFYSQINFDNLKFVGKLFSQKESFVKNRGSLKILILPFETISTSQNTTHVIERVIFKRINEKIIKDTINIQVLFDEEELDFKNNEVEKIRKYGEDRNADLLIYGDLFSDQKENEVKVKWLLVSKIESYLGNDGASELKPINQLSQIYNGYLQGDIDYLILWCFGLGSYIRNDFLESQKNFTEMYKLQPEIAKKDFYLNYYYANVSLFLHDFMKAKSVYEKLLQQDLPQNMPLDAIYTNLGSLFSIPPFVNFDSSKFYYEKSLKFNKEDFFANANLGSLWRVYYKNMDSAKKYYSEALKFKPDASDIARELADLNLLQKDYEGAKILYEKSLSISTNDGRCYNNLGNIFYIQNNLDSAKYYFETGMKKNPFETNILFNLATCFQTFQFYDSSLFYFKKVIEINPNDQLAYQKIGVLYHMFKNDLFSAKYYYQRAIELDSLDPVSLLNLGICYQYAFGNLDSAIFNYEKSIRIKPNPDAFAELGLIYNNIFHNFKASEKFLFKAIEVDVKFARAYFYLAQVYMGVNEKTKGRKNYIKAIELNKQFKSDLYDHYYEVNLFLNK